MGNTGCAGATTCGSIAGGFVRIDVAEMAHAWEACRSRPLGIGDFRAYLAAREMVARRQAGALDRSPAYRTAELADLLGVKARAAAAAVRRLGTAGLITWAEAAIDFPRPPTPGRLQAELANTIGGGRDAVSIPRRILRFLARGATAALIATALGALLRCLSRRRSGFGVRGRFKASWIARTFGVTDRHTKAARARLVALGWLQPEDGDQWALNRWGRAFRIRLDWADPDANRHPSPANDGRQSSPPDLHPDPLREEEHPEPAPGGPAGASLDETAMKTPGLSTVDPASTSLVAPNHDRVSTNGTGPAGPASDSPVGVTSSPKPDLRDITAEDLVDTERVLQLHHQAVGRGVVNPSEADRVRFMAAAEHARTRGTMNPSGLFARIVTNGWWHLLTQQDEDRAVRRLSAHGRLLAPGLVTWRSSITLLGLPKTIPSEVTRSSPVLPGQSRPPSALSDVLARLVSCSRPE